MSYLKNYSLRFRASNSAYASLTPAAGTQDKWKILWRGKRGLLGSQQCLISAGATSDDQIYFNSSDKLCWDFAGTNRLVSTRVFRDPAAHMTIEVIYDAANGTDAEKARVFVSEHGEPLTEITAWDTDTRSSISTGTGKINTNVAHNIGRRLNGTTNYFDGVVDEVALIDNDATPGFSVSADATTGATIPEAPTGAKWWLAFESNASTAALGTDTGSDGVSWTMTNFSVTAGVTNDSLVDTPTNYGTDTGAGGEVRGNYPTFNPLDPNSNVTFSEANLRLVGSASYRTSRINWPLEDQDLYWEVDVGAIGAGDLHVGIGSDTPSNYLGTWAGNTADGWVYALAGGNKFNAGSGVAYGTVASATDVIGVAWKGSTRQLFFRRNGIWQASGDPVAGANPAYSSLNAARYWPVVTVGNGADATLNAGQRPFRDAAPSGFKALCTQNLPDPAVLNPSTEFAAVIATESNIDATLAAASGWSDYVRILKNRSNSETWAWQFSHDASNEYAVGGGTSAYQAKRTNSGADNWVGYGIKVNGTAGVKAGSVSHTNGADTTVTHNSGVSARQLILLFSRAGGDVMLYHPDLSAGNLLKLNSSAAQAADVAIKSVGANSFQIDTGEATGTYDYLVIPELDGFFDLGTVTGNLNADGPVTFEGHAPQMRFQKQRAAAGEFLTYDSVRDSYNPHGSYLFLESSGAQGTLAAFDFLGSGVKTRTNNSTVNGSSVVSVYASFAKLPFKYLTSPYVSPEPGGPDPSASVLCVMP